MLDTLGMDDWNINFVKDDVVKEVGKRVDNLGDLNNIKEKLEKGLWAENRNTIVENCNKFADLVRNQM